MKLKFNYLLEFYKLSISGQRFMLIFLLSIGFSLYAVFQVAFGYDYVTGGILIFSNGIYIMSFLLVLFLNTTNIFNVYTSNSFYIIRLSDKKEYMKHLVCNTIFSNLCTIVMNIMLILIGLNLFNYNDTGVIVKTYEMSGGLYFIYTIFKFIILMSFIGVGNVCLLRVVNHKIIIFLNIIFGVLIATMFYHDGNIISSIFDIPIFIGAYFMSFYYSYSSFIFEILCFLTFSFLIFFLLIILSKFLVKYIKDVI